jgi:hypothetical protein
MHQMPKRDKFMEDKLEEAIQLASSLSERNDFQQSKLMLN